MAAIIGNRNITLGVMGGTLITAACYSGGDVFGCSPYDAATTAYLHATYPQYWQAIEQFGFDNPQLVPWINEDNDLIVSLVEVGKERWLKGDGVAYIILNYTPTNKTIAKARIKDYQGNQQAPIIVASTGTDRFQVCYIGDVDYNAMPRLDGATISLGGSYLQYDARNGLDILLDAKNKICKINGVTAFSGYSGTINSARGKLRLYSIDGADTRSKASIAYLDCEDETIGNLGIVPCKNPNGSDYGMLDLVNLQWYGNANTSGAFTIELTDTPT